MMDMILNGGPFGILVNLLGLAALVLNIWRIASRGRISIRMVVAVAGGALLVGLFGTSFGIYLVSGAVVQASDTLGPDEVANMWHAGSGIAQIPTVFGAAWFALNALLLSVSRSPR